MGNATNKLASYGILELSRAGDPYLFLRNTNSQGVGNSGFIEFYQKNGNGSEVATSRIGGSTEATHATQPSGNLKFYTASSGGSLSERMRISSDGNVSLKGGRLIIGEADVASGHIDSFENLTFNIDTDNDDTNRYFSFTYNASAGAGTEVLRIDEADGGITGGGLKLYGGILGHKDSDASSITLVGGSSSANSGANITLGGTSGSATREVIFKSNSTETMRIDSDGAVSIKSNGSNNTPASLSLWSTDTSISNNDSVGRISAQGTDSGGSAPYLGGKIEFNADADWDTSSSNYHPTRIDLFTQDNSGTDTTTTPRMTIDSDGNINLNSAAPILKVTATNNASGLRINTVGLTSGHLFRVQKDGTTKFEIDHNGRVGIGTASITRTLTVDSGTTDTVALFRSSGDANAYILLEDSNTTTGPHIGAVTDDLVLRTNNSERIRIASTGRVTVKKSSNAEAQSITIASNAASIDLDAGNNFEVSIPSSGSTNIETSSSSGLTVGQSGVIRLAQGGGATTFSTIFKWQSGTTPTPSTSGVDLIAYYVDSSTTVSATYLTNVS